MAKDDDEFIRRHRPLVEAPRFPRITPDTQAAWAWLVQNRQDPKAADMCREIRRWLEEDMGWGSAPKMPAPPPIIKGSAPPAQAKTDGAPSAEVEPTTPDGAPSANVPSIDTPPPKAPTSEVVPQALELEPEPEPEPELKLESAPASEPKMRRADWVRAYLDSRENRDALEATCSGIQEAAADINGKMALDSRVDAYKDPRAIEPFIRELRPRLFARRRSPKKTSR